ncbi:MAG: hypothetical protein IKE53_10050 [Clostridiales bacterium]|nr:hypothetical protein [Clostridiales bacterium]
MKYSVDTYRLYQSEKHFAHTVRIHVRMKDEVDINVLDKAVNKAIRRYPYFAVRVTVDKDGGYVLQPNDNKIVVMPTSDRLPLIGSSDINGHLLYVDCDGKDIFFNISHTMCGGRGFQPWVMTNIYEYVRLKYNVEPYAPEIRKPDSALLPGETDEPSMDMLTTEEPISKREIKKAPVLGMDYLKGVFIPIKRDPNYMVVTVEQKDLIKVAKMNDSSVLSLFFVLFARTLDRVFPEKDRFIVGEAAHNLRESVGLPNTHCDFLSHVHVDYNRDDLNGDLERLGTMTRGQIILQTDPSVSHAQVRKLFELYEEIDKVKGLKAKRKYMAKHSLSTGKDAQHGSFIANYTGLMDWGELADYVEFFVFVIEGHFTVEITAMADKIFVGFMQVINTDRYINLFREELERAGIPCKVEGPFPKRLPKHGIPTK